MLAMTIGLRAAALENINGVIFSDLKNVSLKEGSWDLSYKLDMNNFMTSVIKFKECREQVETLCSKLKNDMNCPYFKKFMTQYEKSLKYSVDRIKKLTKRPKRFLGAVIIYALIDYFFFHDDVDQEIIDKLQKTDNDLREFVSEHISSQNKTINIEKKLFPSIANSISVLRSKLNEVVKLQNIDNIRAQLGNVIQTMTLMTIENNEVMENLIKLAYKEKTADFIGLIGSEILIKNLKQISEKLGENQRLPFNVHSDNLWELQRLAEVGFQLTENNFMIVKIRIPIIDKQKYAYHKIIPIPIKIDDKMIIINNTAQGIIFNEITKDHILISDNLIEKCIEILDGSFMCKLDKMFSKVDGCEMNLLNHNSTKDCNFGLIPVRNYVVKISQNMFYILPDRECKISVECRNGTEIKNSYENGNILSIQSGCTMENSYFKYTVEEELTNEVILIPSINAVEVKIPKALSVDPLNDSILIMNVSKEYSLMEQELRTLHNKTKAKFEGIKHSPKLIGIMMSLCLAIVLFICVKYCCKMMLKKI